MSNQKSGNQGPRRANRGWAALAGATAAMATLAAVVALYADASRTEWLAPTTANVAALANCNKLSGMRPRAACVERVVAAVKAAADSRQVARSEPTADHGK